jgi:hypothetical protein
VYAVNSRHALVGQEQGYIVAAEIQLLQKIERAFGGAAAQNTIISPILRTQVALDRAQNIRVVIHAQ